MGWKACREAAINFVDALSPSLNGQCIHSFSSKLHIKINANSKTSFGVFMFMLSDLHKDMTAETKATPNL